MVLIPLGVVWVGYTLAWYGHMLLRGPGIGIADIVLPGHIAKVDAIRTAALSDFQVPNPDFGGGEFDSPVKGGGPPPRLS